MRSPFSTMVSEAPQLSQGRAKEELFSSPLQSCSHSRILKTELRSRDETWKKHETQGAPDRKGPCRVVAARAGWLRAVPRRGWCRCGPSGFLMPDVVSQTPLYPARVSMTNGENVTEKKPKWPRGLVDKRCMYLSLGSKAELQYAGREQTEQLQHLPVPICEQPPHRQLKQHIAIPVSIIICKLIYSQNKHTSEGRGKKQGGEIQEFYFFHWFLLWILFHL